MLISLDSRRSWKFYPLCADTEIMTDTTSMKEIKTLIYVPVTDICNHLANGSRDANRKQPTAPYYLRHNLQGCKAKRIFDYEISPKFV
jgi:hypothetical protein